MRRLLGPVGGPLTFVLVAALVFAGLGWVTVVALRVERAQREAAAEAERGHTLRTAMRDLDNRMLPTLAVEDSRPFYHYASADPLSGSAAGPTPLLAAPLPDWMRLHVQLDRVTGWESPQVLAPAAAARVKQAWPDLELRNNDAERAAALCAVRSKYPAAATCALLAARARAIPDGSPPFAAPLFALAELNPAAPSAPPKAPPPSAGPAEPFRLFGWEFRRRVAVKVAEQKEAAPVAQAPANTRGSHAQVPDNDRARFDYNSRAQTLQRAIEESKNAGQDPLNTKNYPQNNYERLNNSIWAFPPPAPGPAPPQAEKDKVAKAPAAARPVPWEDRPPPNNFLNPLVGPPVNIHLGSMRPQWLTAADGSEMLVLARVATIDGKTVYQGVIVDWPKLQLVLKEELGDRFLAAAALVPVTDAAGVSPDRAMTALPVQLDPGPPPEPPPAGWTPLRVGLLLAWLAAVLACAAVGLSGWSLIDLAERRIRFVSAVTHELRTPLTSLRLYLDLLTSGMIHDEAKKQEYLNTLATESERLHRLVDNVLDFAKLEKRRANGDLKPVKVSELLDRLRTTWAERVAADGKELVVASTLPDGAEVCTDAAMVQQIVGNLIDNARKYARDAADPRIWLRALPGGTGRVVFEVEDRGTGIPAGERKSVFKPFRRGATADATAGGAGLGLALAKQWAEALGGTVAYRPAAGATGACFRLELPWS